MCNNYDWQWARLLNYIFYVFMVSVQRINYEIIYNILINNNKVELNIAMFPELTDSQVKISFVYKMFYFYFHMYRDKESCTASTSSPSAWQTALKAQARGTQKVVLLLYTHSVFFFLLIMNNENVQFAITLAVKSLLKSFYKRESVSEM